MVLPRIVRQSKPGIGSRNRRGCGGIGRGVIGKVNMVIVAEVMVETQSAEVKCVAPGHHCAEPAKYLPAEGVDGNSRSNLREVALDEILYCRIQQARGNLRE